MAAGAAGTLEQQVGRLLRRFDIAVVRDYGVVVESVNVSVLLYRPALKASPAETCCLKSSVIAASLSDRE